MFPCGPNSYCSSNISPPCTCLRGFHPRNQHNWDMLVGEAGCMRTKPLDCLNNTDEFFRLSVTKLPDASRSTVLNANWNFEECRFFCLSNCACRAYAASIISGNGSGSGSGCLIWTEDLTDITVNGSGLGQDLYVRYETANICEQLSKTEYIKIYICCSLFTYSVINCCNLSASPSEARHANRNILMFVILPPAILFLACVAYSIWRRKKTSSHIDYEAEEKDMELPLFDLTTIKDATDDFSADNKLGQGGFGPVYKGKLGDDQEIAVKRLSKTSSQGVDEFKNEITLIAKLQHRNLVKLLGCCIQGGERLLIYEYMSNGSLDNFLFDEVQTVLLDWRARYNIILGVARDFGMARIFGGDESVSITKRVVETYGYISPEYIINVYKSQVLQS
ncbi:receptor-like serine/threonine-protein kinase SD1-7 isoform X4 [Zingiber officinale]|uniref:receptor-like serine/threonine-protein kinase SD1-7 isoform X4 n=1 Tax=Zingiber officinale TaxID=94328 RepID=UPI001C4B0E68|nr:receptor-like serine/threonine-protein kinase SD1-7 isoform X4 [Zingiber officinale]